jgi:hypothetical protein
LFSESFQIWTKKKGAFNRWAMEALYGSLDAALEEMDLGSSVMLPQETVLRELHSDPSVAAQFATSSVTLKRESVAPSEPLVAVPSVVNATKPPVPPDDLRLFADRTALYVARGGEQLERVIAAQERGNPTFCFLQPEDRFHPYYRERLAEAQEAARVEAAGWTGAVSGDYRADLSQDVMMVSGGRFAEEPAMIEEPIAVIQRAPVIEPVTTVDSPDTSPETSSETPTERSPEKAVESLEKTADDNQFELPGSLNVSQLLADAAK